MRDPHDDPTSIGNILLRMGFVTKDQLDAIAEEQKTMREDLLMGNLMVAKGWITRDQLDLALAAQRGMRDGGRSGQALAVAELSLAKTAADSETRLRLSNKAHLVASSFQLATAKKF